MDYVERAHAFVFVVSAQQPFKASDEQNLRRILGTLRKELIVIAVNRVDQLNEPKEVERVLARVRDEVAKRFPDTSIPIVPVSAHWANLVAGRDATAARRLRNDGRLWEMAYYRNLLTADEEERCRSSSDALFELAGRLSGIAELRQAIDEKLLASRGLAILRSAWNTVEVGCRDAESGAVSDRDEKLRLAAAKEHSREAAEQELVRLQDDARRISQFCDDAQGQIEHQREVIPRAISAASARFRRGLEELASEEARAVVARFSEVVIRGGGDKKWKYDYSDMRERLREHFESSFADELERLGRSLQDLTSAIETDLPEELSDKALRRRLRDALGKGGGLQGNHPSLSALAGRAEVELGNWFERLMSGNKTSREKAQELAESVRSDGFRAARGLSDEAVTSLTAAMSTRLDAIRTALNSVFANRDERLVTIQRQLDEVRKGADPTTVARQVEALRTEARRSVERAARLAEIRREIGTVVLPAARVAA